MDSICILSAHLLRTACLAALLFVGACAARGEPDKLALVALLKNSQFTTLESELVPHQQRSEAQPEAEWPVNAAFFAFANSYPPLVPRLNEWIASVPHPYAAPLPPGMFHVLYDWNSHHTL